MAALEQSTNISPPTPSTLQDEVDTLRKELENTRKELAAVKMNSNSSNFSSISELPDNIGNNSTFSDPFAVTFHSIIIFGAEGNLALKKTFPALFTLMRQRRLPMNVSIIGYARESLNNEQFQKLIYRNIYNISHPQADRNQFLGRLSYIQGQFNDIKHFEKLKIELDSKEKEQENEWLKANSPSSTMITANFKHIRTFYLAVPPFLYPDIAKGCHLTGLKRNPNKSSNPNKKSSLSASSNNDNDDNLIRSHIEENDRFILEKPFGKDTESCKELSNKISEYLSESQIYRIDHYLGKELVMNMLVMRFANICFNSIWDRNHVHSVHVICKEAQGTYGRGGYFDEYGIIRDVMQNHLLQILALVGMEQPLSLSAEHIRQEKVKLLQSVEPLQVENLLIGQFSKDNKGNPGYLDDDTIKNKDSLTETYATTVLYINNPRWSGVPFILKAGKGLDESKVEIRIRFHAVPGAIPTIAQCNPNELVIRVQPNECIYWKITSKIPGLDFNIETRRMDLLYGSKNDRTSNYGGNKPSSNITSNHASNNPTQFTASSTPSVMKSHAMMNNALKTKNNHLSSTSLSTISSSSSSSSHPSDGDGGMIESPGAYERLILEVMRGDQTNFVHRDELLCSWRIFTPALHELSKHQIKPEIYKFGSSGPKSELEFSKKFGFPKGFAHDVDHEKKTQAIAWGNSTVNSDGEEGSMSRASSPSRSVS